MWIPTQNSVSKPGLEKSGRLVAICDQKIFFATRSWAAVVNLATNFSTQGSSLATPVLRWVPYADKRYCRATGKERQVSENYIQNFENLSRYSRNVNLAHSQRRKVSHTLPAQRITKKIERTSRSAIPTCHKYPA